jgi:PilZ domain
VPRLLTAILAMSVVATAWYALTVLGVTPVHYTVPWAVNAAFAWMLVNVTLVWLAIRRVRSPRYAGERRSSVRFATDMPARLDGLEATVRDVSLTGARIEMPVAAAIAEHAALTIEVPGGVLHFTGSSRSSWTDRRGRTMVGFEFDPEQHPARARLALALFGAAEPFDAEPVIQAKPKTSRRKRPARVETAA